MLSKETREKIYRQYIEALCDACRVYRIPIGCVEYSDRELAFAVEEAEIDLQAMLARRSRSRGISKGKIAGVLVFRLSRFKILHFTAEGWENSNFHLIQELTAVFLVIRLLSIAKIKERSVVELTYQLSRRHANQETAGLFFDAFTSETV